ncbi:WecB/TagA/CpsF family glycosyltransferase [soil metagenome]
MIDHGRHSVLGIEVDAVDYDQAVARIVDAAQNHRPLAVSALASHGVMTGATDPDHARRLNGLDLVVPDGQPVRWALRWLHGISLPDRVYGPELTGRVFAAAEEEGLPVYFYGSTEETLGRLLENLRERHPQLQVAGAEPSRFRRLDAGERAEVIARITASGARIVFVGLGCPRQEVFAFEYRDALSIPLLAVGAAFDFHAGTLAQAPDALGRRGLEWAFRLWHEPKRLWHRYLVLGPSYLSRVAMQRLGFRVPPVLSPTGEEPIESYG